jgi:Zn-finger domain-containing protein
MKHAGALVAALTALLVVSCKNNKGTVFLENRTDEPIAHATVVICGQTINFNDILAKKSVSGSYSVKSDSDYDVRIEFQSGKQLHKQVGYVTNGIDFQDEIVVTDTDIAISQ